MRVSFPPPFIQPEAMVFPGRPEWENEEELAAELPGAAAASNNAGGGGGVKRSHAEMNAGDAEGNGEGEGGTDEVGVF